MAKQPMVGFTIADGRSLPKLDKTMLLQFLYNDNFVTPESKNIKTLRACDPNYGDNAVGYTQVNRDGIICTVRGEVCPQHKVHDKNYDVYVVIDETKDDECILEATCEDCVASAGGCKHLIAFLFYLHRKSEEGPVTAQECLWKRPKLSTVGRSLKLEPIAKLHPPQKLKRPITEAEKIGFFNFLTSDLQLKKSNATVLRHLGKKHSLTMHHLFMAFKGGDSKQDVKSFLEFSASRMTTEECQKVAHDTLNQANSPLWHLYRQSRITASRIYEASRCHTTDGTLVNSILGAVGIPDTEQMARGRIMEPKVLSVLSKKYGAKVQRSGLLLNAAHPELGASPDGLLNDHVIEVKCPSSENAVKSYFNDDFTEPSPKFLAQIMTQMHFCGKSKGIFCVANTKFDGTSNQKVTTLIVEKNDNFFLPVLVKAKEFWLENIFPKVYETI